MLDMQAICFGDEAGSACTVSGHAKVVRGESNAGEHCWSWFSYFRHTSVPMSAHALLLVACPSSKEYNRRAELSAPKFAVPARTK